MTATQEIVQHDYLLHFAERRRHPVTMRKALFETLSVRCVCEHFNIVGSVIEWLKRHAYDQHGSGSKPTRAILLCPWERHFAALSPAW